MCPRPSLGQRTKESVFGKFVRAVAAVEQQLREQNVSIDIVIPPVYAMGMQSAGKSSTLERVVGAQVNAGAACRVAADVAWHHAALL